MNALRLHLRALTFIAFVNTSEVAFVSCSINFAVDCYNRVFVVSDCSIRMLDCSIRVFRSFSDTANFKGA